MGIPTKKGKRNLKYKFDLSEKTIANLYYEKTIWSQKYKLWKLYGVRKPRLPEPDENKIRWVDNPQHRPHTFSLFIGKHNDAVVKAFTELKSSFENEKILPFVLIVHGPSGSGKTSLMQCFLKEITTELGITHHLIQKWILQINAEKFEDNFNDIWMKISKFTEAPIDGGIPLAFRVIVIENADCITPSSQQGLKRLLEIGARIRFFFVLRNPKSLISFVQEKAMFLKTKKISEVDCLTTVLTFLQKMRIGFDREGVKKLLDLNNSSFSLCDIYDQIQNTFIKYHYISKENIEKNAKINTEKKLIPSIRAFEPYVRCKICTLFPPCKHITLEKMAVKAKKVIKDLPRYKTGSMVCPEWERYGRCTHFMKYNHCSLDHPKNIHTIVEIPRKCPCCTLVWPCNHCAYTIERKKCIDVVSVVRARIHLLKQLIVPDPPMSLVAHLDEIQENWRSYLIQYEKMYATKDKLSILKEVDDFIADSYAIEVERYNNLYKKVALNFGEIIKSELLEPIER